ncbi:MAG: PucR family transcriptional regulator ligand-binding domain-containing protein [Leucobacter sp.]
MAVVVFLSNVLLLPDLGLTAVTEFPKDDREIRWAHVSELLDPTPWLLGGELLLTTGVNFTSDNIDYLHYCHRLVNAGVAGLGMSTGPDLPHPSVPKSLQDAATAAGLPLIHVPQETLLQSVIQRVSEAINDSRNVPMFRAFSAQRTIGEASTSKKGIERVIAGLSRTMGLEAVVLDERLQIVTSSSAQASESVWALRQELRPRLREGLRWSSSSGGNDQTTVAQPLGLEGQLRGILVVRSNDALSTQDRVVLGTAVSLLSLLLELRYSNNDVTRAVRDRVMEVVLDETLSREKLVDRIRSAGLTANTYRVLVTNVPDERHLTVALATELSEISVDVLLKTSGEELIALLIDPTEDAIQELEHVVTDLRLGPAGLGNAVQAGGIYESLHQARFTRSVAQARDLNFLARSDAGGYRELLALGDKKQRKQFADDVLSKLEVKNGAEGSHVLIETLQAYLRNLGNIEAAASTLNIHRHTMRKRLHRIEELIDRDFTVAEDLFETWLALELRTLGDQT